VYGNAVTALNNNGDYEEAATLAGEYAEALLQRPHGLDRDKALADSYGAAARAQEGTEHWAQAANFRTQQIRALSTLKPDAYDELPNDMNSAQTSLVYELLCDGRRDEARTAFHQILTTAGKLPLSAQSALYLTLVQRLRSSKHYDFAREYLDADTQFLLGQPAGDDRDRALADVYMQAGFLDEDTGEIPLAVTHAKQAVALLTALNNRHAYEGALSGLAGETGGLAWYEIQAGQFADGLKDAQAGFAEDPTQTWIEVNEAHALLLTGKTEEARSLYLKIRNYPRGSSTLLPDITADLKTLCKLKYAPPAMVSIAQDLGIEDAELSQCFAARGQHPSRGPGQTGP